MTRTCIAAGVLGLGLFLGPSIYGQEAGAAQKASYANAPSPSPKGDAIR